MKNQCEQLLKPSLPILDVHNIIQKAFPRIWRSAGGEILFLECSEISFIPEQQAMMESSVLFGSCHQKPQETPQQAWTQSPSVRNKCSQALPNSELFR